jgi:hypothetical protein
VILVAAVSLGTQPALFGDAVQDAQPSAIADRVRPLDLVKSSARSWRPFTHRRLSGESARHRAFGVRGAFQSIRIR